LKKSERGWLQLDTAHVKNVITIIITTTRKGGNLKIISICSVKGGVGKTATTTFLSQALHAKGYKVLVIDSDANNNLTDYYLRETSVDDIEARNLYHLIKGDMSPDEVIYPGRIDIIPCTLSLHKIGLMMTTKPTAIMHFQKSIKRLDYDYVLIDSPPALGYELTNALYCSDIVLIPANFTRWTLQSIQIIQEQIEEMKADGKKFLNVKAVPSIVTDKENNILQSMGLDFTKSYIKKSGAIKTAHDNATWIKTTAAAFEYFNNLSEEII
jgi:chromosome partitioning protein